MTPEIFMAWCIYQPRVSPNFSYSSRTHIPKPTFHSHFSLMGAVFGRIWPERHVTLPPRTARLPHHLAGVWPNVSGVPLNFVYNASHNVPAQHEAWTCGINSGARFATMLGQHIWAFQTYLASAPYYGGGLGIPRVGPNPENLQNYLRSQSQLHGSDIGQRCTKHWPDQEPILIRALDLGRPALVLFVYSGTRMHWVNLVGRHRETRNYYYLDTNGSIVEISEGSEGLRRCMEGRDCYAQRTGFIERYNSVTCTNASEPKDPSYSTTTQTSTSLPIKTSPKLLAHNRLTGEWPL
jgi:hypothetical protein